MIQATAHIRARIFCSIDQNFCTFVRKLYVRADIGLSDLRTNAKQMYVKRAVTMYTYHIYKYIYIYYNNNF